MNGTSKTKFCKGTNIPKHSGNFSAMHARYLHYKTREYEITLRDGILFVGEHTQLDQLVPSAVGWLMLNDPNFKEYRQEGEHSFGGKKYDASRIITKSIFASENYYIGSPWKLRETIDTEGDFNYNFPEY